MTHNTHELRQVVVTSDCTEFITCEQCIFNIVATQDTKNYSCLLEDLNITDTPMMCQTTDTAIHEDYVIQYVHKLTGIPDLSVPKI